jgi:hypothetical protein
MKRIFSTKIIIAILSLFILTASVGLYVYAASDVNAVIKDCKDFCKQYTDEYDNYACFKGCIAGHMQ